MALSITNNIAALNAYQNLTDVQNKLTSSIAKLSSGNAITSAGDNAAGLAISTGLTSQVNGLNQAATNAQSGLDVVQTASGALTQVTSMLQRLRDLAVQAANDSNSTASRADIQTEATQITDELTRVSSSTNYNGTNLIDGSAAALTFQVGANAGASNEITVDLSSIDVGTIATTLASNSYADNAGAQASITAIDTALTTVSTAQATLGATENRFNDTIASVNVASQNLNSASSEITSTDMAKEMVMFTGQQVQAQAATAILAQANQLTQGVLKLLQ
ncbi:MAG TPA: flagellin [Galbitalea sp.]|jgi:flagellin